jgi:hypothetical protein
VNLRQLRISRWLVAFALFTTLVTVAGTASAEPTTDMYDPDVRLSDGFYPPDMGNQLIVTSTCAPNNDLTQPSTITVAQRASGAASIPVASVPEDHWLSGNLTWQLTATIGAQTQTPVGEFWPFTIDGAPTGSHGLPTGALTSFAGQFSIDRAPTGNYPGPEDIGGTLSLGTGGGNWGVCRKYNNEPSGSPNPGGNLTGAIHSLNAGSLTYTVTQGPDGLQGETGVAAATLMNSHAIGVDYVCPTPPCIAIATGHFRLEFGTTIPAGGSQSTGAGGGVAPVTVEPMPDVSLTFTDVTGDGPTNVVQTTDAPTLPGGFQLANNGLFYEIKTAATYTPPIRICLPTASLPQGVTPQILHYESGNWVNVPTAVEGEGEDEVACGNVNSLSPVALGYEGQTGTVNVWVGLKTSDDVGTTFEIKADLSGEGGSTSSTATVSKISSGFNNAKLVEIPVTEAFGVDDLTLTLSARVACTSSHASGTARLWYNDSGANSRVQGSLNTKYLQSGFLLGDTLSGPRLTRDVLAKGKCSNTWVPFGTWSTGD